MKILKDVEKVIRLPPSCNRQDVRLLNNRILPHPSEVVAVDKNDEKYQNNLKTKGMEKDSSLRKRIIGLRLTLKEYEQIEKQCRKSTANKISEYVRHILFNKPITVYQRNKSLDDFMAEMVLLRNELNGIGNNFNQAVKKLHTLQQISEFKSWIITYELEKKILFNKIDEIKNRINKIADEWLQ